MQQMEALKNLGRARPGRLPAVDGLRGVAVALVLVRHLHGTVLPAGGIGVDVFFVISGFVITRKLLGLWDSQRLKFGGFYWSRWTRLMPALAALVIAVDVALIIGGSAWRRDLEHSPLALFYVMDFYRAAAPPGGYVGGIFGHTWSLGVEEQFYLLWPVLLVVLLRRVDPKRIPAILAVVCGLILVERFAFAAAGPQYGNRIYNAPDTRFDQLLFGCILALLAWHGLSERLRKGAALLAWPAMVGLLILARLYHPDDLTSRFTRWGTPFIFTVTAGLAVIVVACAAFDEQHSLSRVLAWRPILAVGTVSYSLYLWHYPVIQLLVGHNDASLGAAKTLLALVLSLALAVLSWWQIELRFHPPSRVSRGSISVS